MSEGQPLEGASSLPAAGRIVRAAGINSLGNVASRVMGLLREAVIAATFGASGATSAFDAVSGVPKMVYELLVGGMLSAALVPVLSEYAPPADPPASAEEEAARARKQAELNEVLSVLLSLGGLVFLLVTAVLELGAPWIAKILVGGFDRSLLDTATLLVRLIVPSIIIYGLSGLLQAYHYANQRFVYPAMGAPAHNLGVIIAVVLLARRLDVASLSIGIVVAALTQFLVQLPGLRGVRLAWRFDWRHPVVRRVLGLYAPVVLSIVIQNIGIIIDRNLASRTVNEAITWMAKATFLIQLPLGLVSMAISLAVLPTLSQMDARAALEAFKRTFSRGLRLVIVLIIPAGVGLAVLGRPIIALIFEHGAFTPADSLGTWQALRLYLLGLPFAAIDLPLIFAFYAQKDTLTPVIVGIIAVVIYLIVGPTLAFALGWGYLGLVMANSAQLAAHALIMLVLFRRRFGSLGGFGVLRATGQALLGSLPLAGLSWVALRVLEPILPHGFIGEVALVTLCGGAGAVGYAIAMRALHMEEWEMLQRALVGRWRPKGFRGEPSR